MTGLPSVICPACQTEMGLEALLGTDDARAVVEIMARIPGSPSLRKALLRYCGLFAPTSQKLRWGRVERLLGELVAIMESGRVERNGRTWPAPLDYWQNALDAVLANVRIRRPLKSHGYLLEVLVGQADGVEARAESRTEQKLRGAAGAGGGAERAQRTGMPTSVQEQLKHFTHPKKGGQ